MVHFSALDGECILDVHAELEEVHGELVSMMMQRPDAFPVDSVLTPACIEVLGYKHGIKASGKLLRIAVATSASCNTVGHV